MMHSFSHSFIQQILTEMGRARDKGPEELNRDTDRHRSGRKPRKPGRQVCRGRDLTHLSPRTDARTGEGPLRELEKGQLEDQEGH